MFDSEAEATAILKAEGQRLNKLAVDLWREYLNDYKPKVYVRTGHSIDSIKLGQVKRYDEDTLCIELTWEDDLTYHPSVFTNGFPKGNSILLISEGWRVSKGWHKNIERFGYYEGWNYLGKLQKAFEAEMHNGITFQYTGKQRAVKTSN